jgi:hypothetical protein
MIILAAGTLAQQRFAPREIVIEHRLVGTRHEDRTRKSMTCQSIHHPEI